MATQITETNSITQQEFHNEIIPKGEPLVIRGLVNDWPLVAAGKAGADTFCNYLKKFDLQQDVPVITGPPSTKGRIFYNADMSGLNCRTSTSKLSAFLDYLLEHSQDQPPPLMAMQSIVIAHHFNGIQQQNRLNLLPHTIEPRLWIGGQATVAAHYDPSENIACCIAGKRRFTLFPPEQITNLYIGPWELTPAGAAISMVNFDQPDYTQHPRFKLAEQAALQTELAPGDAIYIPYLWWHHVSSLEPVNALVNYWWGSANEMMGDPRDALLHAMMTMRALPKRHKDAWHAMFEHYAFERSGSPGEHLPPEKRGILGAMNADIIRKLRAMLAKNLSR